MKKSDKIFINEWLSIKPYKKQVKTDYYYLKLSNDIKSILEKNASDEFFKYIDKQIDFDAFCCFIASYFEDIISNTNIWNSFIKLHTRIYNKKLPFYNVDEYFDNEINQQDVAFLIWYFINGYDDDLFLNPNSDFILQASTLIMTILEKEFEYAPENEFLYSFYQLNDNENDFYIARNYIDKILFQSYLFFYDTNMRLYESNAEILEKKKNKEHLLMFLNENRDSLLHKSSTKLLALKGNVWAAEILGNKKPVSVDLLQMSPKITGLFLYKGHDSKDIFIEHIASGKKFNMTKKSYDNIHLLKEIDLIMFIGIVKWRDEWWFSGVNTISSFNPDIILDEKNSIASRSQVNFIDYQTTDINDYLNKQFNVFLKYNKGQQIAFLHSDKINEFIRKYVEFFNKSLNLSDKEIEEALQRARKDGFLKNDDNQEFDFKHNSESGLVFFNPISGIEIAMNINSAFPMENNPFYNLKDSIEDFEALLMSDSLSKELLMFCIETCKDKLIFFNDNIGEIYIENIDFLSRFWKKESYYSKPSITLTGLQD